MQEAGNRDDDVTDLLLGKVAIEPRPLFNGPSLEWMLASSSCSSSSSEPLLFPLLEYSKKQVRVGTYLSVLRDEMEMGSKDQMRVFLDLCRCGIPELSEGDMLPLFMLRM